MDGAWPPPPPQQQPSAALAPAPPPLRSQMDNINLRYHLRPFAAAQLQDGRTAAMPEQLSSNPWSSLSGQPAKGGPSNPLLAQVHGNYYPHVSHVPDLKSLLDRPNASNAAGVVDLTRASTLSGGAPLQPKYPRHGLSASSSVEQSSLGALFLNKSSNVQGTLPGEGSANDGMSHGAVQFQYSSAHTMQKLASKSIPRYHPALPGDRIRVSCLNVGGEFFVGEAGLFGVLCSCHQLRMSVAKFCEHAGGPAEKAGEIVRMENGISIAQWFKYCIGVGASVTDTKWDWPEWVCMDYSPEGYRLKSLLTRNSSMEKIGLSSGYGKITGPINGTVYSNDLHNEGRGCTTVEKLVNKRYEAYYKKSADVHTAFTKNYASLQNSEINRGLAKNHTVNAMNLNPVSMPSGSPYFTANTGGNYNGNHLAHNYADLLEKNLDASFHNPALSSTGVLSYDSRACKSYFPNKILQDSLGSASNTELKLGQSSYHQSMTSLFPSVQSATIDFQKSQSHLQLITQNPCPRQTTKVNKSIGEHTEPPFGTGTKKQSIEVANGINCSEGDELTDDAAKNSFISLFLSHLERNSEAIDDIFNSNEHNLPKALDGAYSSNHSKIASRQVDPRANDNHSKLASTIIHTKRRSDGRSLSVAPSGYVSKVEPLANSQGPSIHSDRLTHLLPSQHNAGISKICAGVSCPANCRSCNHVSDISNQVAHAETGGLCLYDKMARGHSPFECTDDLCTHKSLRVDKIICQCRNSCSSSREVLPSFGQNDQSTLGKSIHRCCCEVQEDVSKLGFKAGHLCRTHFSNDGAPIHKPIVEGLDELCTCSTFIPRSSLCCREHILQSCHAWPLDGFHYRSFIGHATNSLTKYPLLDAPDKKEPGLCWDGRCCYSVVPKCLAGCGFTKHCDVRIDHCGRTVQKCKHDVQLPARCCTLGESEKLRCQCSSNVIAGSSNAQTSFWEDVSNKMTNQPYIPISERLKNVSEESVADGSWSYGVITEKKGSCRGSGISKDQLKSGFSSGSSSAVVTKFSASPEFNNISSCTVKYGVERKKLVFDEGSRIDKCSSSSYVPIIIGCEKALNSSSRFHLDTSKVKRKCNQISDGSTLKENDNEQQCFETRKKSRTLRCSAKPDGRITFQSSQHGDSQPQNEANSLSCRVSKTKRKHTTMQLNKAVKRLHSHRKILKGDDEQSDSKGILVGELNSSDRKKQVEDMTTLDRTKHQQEVSRVFVRKLPKYVSLNCIVNEPNGEDSCSGSAHVDSSLIATGITNDKRKFPKIVPLNLILKKAKRCHAVKPLCKTETIHFSEKKSSLHSVDKSSFANGNYSPQAEDGMQCAKRNRSSSSPLQPHVEADCKSPCNGLGEGEPFGLTEVETSQLSVSASKEGVKNRRSSVSLNRIKRCEDFDGSACIPCGDKDNALQACEVNVRRYKERLSSDDSCCVCGIPNLEPCNQLIECSKCYIKVHQACYGVLKIPRGQWFCRPCKTNTQDTVCVLCGYGGGAMTRALKAQNIVKSLLKGLTLAARPDKYVHSLGNASKHGENVRHDPFYAPRSTSLDTISTSDLQKPIDSAHEENLVSNSWTTNHNSILLGPQTMQWVHVVCGLWTPGTKCPNATTMNAFDISGASPAKRNIACSVCNRTGGSFMECRDINCSVLFHPWCAHRRGLLQSEPEGKHNEKIGFYGRCMDHSTLDYANHVNPEKECLRSNDWTCARTEGFKGRKGEGWSGSNYKKPQENSGECSVSQEQINAWLRINGSKPCIRGQNEYINNKQLKGWKHLVVYKSGIHGLGLYTSEFIPRGSMVVEYVGEIVGQRVADKREIEYQRKQYKTACYFFKIDKEHIIDATRKGGIARFINHSCLPNCVAKIISVRNEKKVVFYAERHLNPGEEITYDYHFNQEDEGQRIHCFCRSRSCRRYLN